MLIPKTNFPSYTQEAVERFLLARCFYEMTSRQIHEDLSYASMVAISLHEKTMCPKNGVVPSNEERASWVIWKQ